MIILNEDILDMILQAEKVYHNMMKNAVNDAEKYAENCRKNQGIYLEEMQEEWYLFEEAENEKLLKKLSEDERKMELEIAESKARLKKCQEKKADLISERLKTEVLSSYGDS